MADSSQPNLFAEIGSHRATVEQQIEAGEREAKRTGKPLVVLAGETHSEPGAAVNDAIAYDLVRAHGFENIAVELAADDTTFRNEDTTKLSDANMAGLPLTYLAGRYEQKSDPGLQVTRMDRKAPEVERNIDAACARGPDFPESALELTPRNHDMADQLRRMQGPAYALVGRDHAPGIAAELRATKTVVILDMADHSLEGGKPLPGSKDLSWQADPGQVGATGLATQAFPGSSKAANGFLAALKNDHWLYTDADAHKDLTASAAMLAGADRTLKAHPGDKNALLDKSDALNTQASALYQLSEKDPKLDVKAGQARAASDIALQQAQNGQPPGSCADGSTRNPVEYFDQTFQQAYGQKYDELRAELGNFSSPRTPSQPSPARAQSASTPHR
ncbi:MAG: hypothetical protein WDN72_01630 [Alphaproteobacteria bacterium]